MLCDLDIHLPKVVLKVNLESFEKNRIQNPTNHIMYIISYTYHISYICMFFFYAKIIGILSKNHVL